jgi:hypothetical protein
MDSDPPTLHPQLLSPHQQAEIAGIVGKICDAIEDDDEYLALEALCACMLGAVQTQYQLSPRHAVEYCADTLRRFGQVVMS